MYTKGGVNILRANVVSGFRRHTKVDTNFVVDTKVSADISRPTLVYITWPQNIDTNVVYITLPRNIDTNFGIHSFPLNTDTNSWEICQHCAKILLAAKHKMQLAYYLQNTGWFQRCSEFSFFDEPFIILFTIFY